MTEKELVDDGWIPKSCKIGTLFFKDSFFCIIYNTYQCSHPILGDKPYDVLPQEAFEKGIEFGKEALKN